MNEYYHSVFGRNMCLDDSYRSLGEQYSVKATKGYLAATPGTSMHGWGLAVDFCSADARRCVRQVDPSNAATFGWVKPALGTTSKYEPWHWEYAPLTASTTTTLGRRQLLRRRLQHDNVDVHEVDDKVDDNHHHHGGTTAARPPTQRQLPSPAPSVSRAVQLTASA